MEKEKKVSFVRNGELRLPPGFRFHPTDEELVVQYLKRKVLAYPLPASIIPEVHVCKSDPWDLPGHMEQERYFFSTREAKYSNGSRSNRATLSGYWKATGLDKQILTSKPNNHQVVVGMKKTLVFYKGKPPHGSRTDWIMHEYRLHNTQSSVVGMQNWVLCRIFLKRRNGKMSTEEQSNFRVNRDMMNKLSSRPVFYDFLSQSNKNNNNNSKTDLNRTPTSSTSSISGITHLSGSHSLHNESDEREEASSSCNSLPSLTRNP
ncbi:NAC domain-containing protein 83-like isoform X1 [Prosopis cineraria]|uniref:NAC domain-containing protein 83-like isoform X1 n=1 Tax=Prosopis cineraria TaxID=364024 RepID=UPI0024106B81|nr:NAC domain-containing protein 83-like isoform X1 [Prosopis cineraria]